MKKLFILLALLPLLVFSQPYQVSEYADNTGRRNVGAIITSALADGERVFNFSPGNYKFTTSVDFPTGVTLIIERGALLDARDTLAGNWTIIEAGDYQIFTRTSKLGGTWEVSEFPFTWFGAIGNDNLVSRELMAADAFAKITRGKSIIFSRNYIFESTDTLSSGVTMILRAGTNFSSSGIVLEGGYISAAASITVSDVPVSGAVGVIESGAPGGGSSSSDTIYTNYITAFAGEDEPCGTEIWTTFLMSNIITPPELEFVIFLGEKCEDLYDQLCPSWYDAEIDIYSIPEVWLYADNGIGGYDTIHIVANTTEYTPIPEPGVVGIYASETAFPNGLCEWDRFVMVIYDGTDTLFDYDFSIFYNEFLVPAGTQAASGTITVEADTLAVEAVLDLRGNNLYDVDTLIMRRNDGQLVYLVVDSTNNLIVGDYPVVPLGDLALELTWDDMDSAKIPVSAPPPTDITIIPDNFGDNQVTWYYKVATLYVEDETLKRSRLSNEQTYVVGDLTTELILDADAEEYEDVIYIIVIKGTTSGVYTNAVLKTFTSPEENEFISLTDLPFDLLTGVDLPYGEEVLNGFISSIPLYITDLTVADMTVDDYNDLFDLPANGTPFTSAVLDGNTVKLYGGEDITWPDGYDDEDQLINFGGNEHLLSVVDNAGCIVECGVGSFRACVSATTFNLPAMITAGVNCFVTCTSATTFNLSSCTDLGSTTDNNGVFNAISGQTITLTCPAALLTCDDGAPDGDLCYLHAFNTLTVNGGALTGCGIDALELTWDDIANVPVADASDVSDWNTFFGFDADPLLYTTVFTSVEVDGNTVKLYGGSGITLVENTFNGEYVESLLGFEDNISCIVEVEGYWCSDGDEYYPVNLTVLSMPGLITAGDAAFDGFENVVEFIFPMLITAGDQCFNGCTAATTFDLPSLTTAGYGCFMGCTTAATFDLSSCTALGTSTGDNDVFEIITGQTITLACPAALLTCNEGAPDGDLCVLHANNTLTVNGGALTGCGIE